MATTSRTADDYNLQQENERLKLALYYCLDAHGGAIEIQPHLAQNLKRSGATVESFTNPDSGALVFRTKKNQRPEAQFTVKH